MATGGDPYDDPRGVSGFQLAYPGEPDLDRIIGTRPHGTFQRPATAADLADHVTAAKKRLRDAVQAAAGDTVARSILTARLAQIGVWSCRFTVAWRVKLTGSDADALLGDGVPPVATDGPWWLEMISTGYDADAQCALLRGVLHVPVVRDDGTAGGGPPPWLISFPDSGPDPVPPMPLDAMGFRPGRLEPGTG